MRLKQNRNYDLIILNDERNRSVAYYKNIYKFCYDQTIRTFGVTTSNHLNYFYVFSYIYNGKETSF